MKYVVLFDDKSISRSFDSEKAAEDSISPRFKKSAEVVAVDKLHEKIAPGTVVFKQSDRAGERAKPMKFIPGDWVE